MVAQLLRLQQPQQLLSAQPFPGQHLAHHTVHLRPADPGHLFPPKPVAGSTGRLPPPGTAQCDDASPPRCGSRTRPAPRRSSPFRTPSRCATWNRPRRPASPEECPRERWTGSSGLRCRPGSGARWPSGFRQASAGWLAAPTEHISPRPLGTLGHRYLPPGLLRQFSTALRQGAPLPAPQPGLAGTPESLVCRAGPLGIHRPKSEVPRNVQDVAHPQGRQAVPEGRRHPEGVVPGNPSRFRWPRAKARCSSSRANSVFDRYRRLSSGTPAAAQRASSAVQLSGR